MRSLDEMLALSPWTRELTAEQLARVKASTVVRDYGPGALICPRGEPSRAWLGVVEGLVKLQCTADSGKSFTLAGIPGGSWFGEGSVLKGEPRRYDVVALRASRMAFMPEATFHWLLDTSFAFNRFLLTQLNERLAHFIGMLEHERLLDLDARVARSLALLFNPLLHPAAQPQIQISQEELGYLVGASRQRVNQALQVLEKAGLIVADYGVVTVLDPEGLARFGGMTNRRP
ncbi:Crp/Fnr family transcriptional regulator [Pelomicrobium sp. G1]|uniref:Crp/Fnr family transcriptional regulator n=1 Tax=unclassified Pelomicrobium TaxID=2815318 RepID=UPI003F75EB35